MIRKAIIENNEGCIIRDLDTGEVLTTGETEAECIDNYFKLALPDYGLYRAYET